MGKYYNQSGHYRTYKQTNTRITVNGGPKSTSIWSGDMWTVIIQIIVGILIFIYI